VRDAGKGKGAGKRRCDGIVLHDFILGHRHQLC
jgi:hypothetical protein